MTRHYLRGYVLRADDDETVDQETGPLRIVAATEGVKGDGLNLTMKGADLGRFETNPVVGYGHMYWGRESLPIGRSDKTWIDGDKLMMDIGFDQEDEFARKVERKYRGGYLNAFSIGFDVWNIDDAGVPEGWELFEVSAVPLPMDPNAVVESGRELELVRALGSRLTADEFAAHVKAQLAKTPGPFADALMAQLTELEATGALRAGAVLSKKNKQLVKDAAVALQALLEAAGGSDDEDDDERQALPDPAQLARMRRLAGI